MKKNNHLIAPSILAADFGRLDDAVSLNNRSASDWLHIDVMDGRFVPNISFGFPVLKAIKKVSTKPLDVHLMIVEPEKYIERFRDYGADVISVHYEACPNLHRTICQIKECGAKAGVAINPHTNVMLLGDVLEDLDLVVVMSVNPGYGGQKFIYQTLNKVRKLKQRITERNLSVLMEIDGGVGLQNASELLKSGADVLVAGSSVFKSDDPIDTINRLKAIGDQSSWV